LIAVTTCSWFAANVGRRRQISIAIPVASINIFFIYLYAIFNALLFISRGTIIAQNNHTQVFYILAPINSTAILISSLALIGTQFITGYYSKHIIII